MSPENKADIFCGLMAGAAGGYDIYAMLNRQETISACVRRHTERPHQKFLLTGLMGGLLVHFLLPPITFERSPHEGTETA